MAPRTNHVQSPVSHAVGGGVGGEGSSLAFRDSLLWNQNVFTAVVLPLALAVIMLGLGLTLTRYDFLRVVIFPKAFLIGLVCQMVLLSLMGFLVAKVFPRRCTA